MSLVFKTPKSTLNTTTKAIQNLGGDCPPCPEPVLESKELEYTQNGEYTVTPEEGVDGFSSIDVTVNIPSDVNNQNKTVNPSTSSQSVSADSGYSGLGTVTVNPVTSSIDANIQAENILEGVTILGVSGTDAGYDVGYGQGESDGYSAGYSEGYAQGQSECPEPPEPPVLNPLSVTPTTSAQTIYPDSSIEDGFSDVSVAAVTAAIDQNITAGNIKSGVTILGVSGSYDPQPTLTNLNITPSTNSQEYNPAISGVDGYSLVRVNAVTSAIDQNITAGNIKNGVSILGVTGNYNPQPNLQSKNANINHIASSDVRPDSGYDGLSSVNVFVNDNPLGSFGYPFTQYEIEEASRIPNLDRAYFLMVVDSSSFTEDQQGNYYTVQDESGNEITKLYTANVLDELDTPYDFTGKTIIVRSNSISFNEDDSDPQNIVYTYTLTTADLQSINGNINDELWYAPDYNGYINTIGRNQIGGVNINVQDEPIGSSWFPFNVWDWSSYVEAVIPDDNNVNFEFTVASGSIDSETGYYVAEDEFGNTFNIMPYAGNPDYDPELTPEEQPGVPESIFPEGFDLTDLSVVVSYPAMNATITENPNWDGEDPASEYSIEVSEANLIMINWNSDMESWPLYWDGTLSGGIETSTRNLHLSTNEPQVMSLSSNEPWEIELDQPQAQSQMNVRPLTKSGLRSPEPEPTLEIDQMEGDAGVFTLNVLSTSDQNTGFTVRGLNSGNEVYVEVNSAGNYFTIESLEDNNVVTFYAYTDNIDLHFRVNDDEWDDVELEQGTSPFNNVYVSSWTLDNGDILQFYGDNDTLALNEMYHQQYCHFGSTKIVDVRGCIASLLDSVSFVNYQLNSKYSFCGLFAKTTYDNQDVVLKIENASDLTMASPYEYSYMQMFQENSYIETPPELPFKQAYKHCYDKMFYSCTSLLSAPELPSVLAPECCYYEMFYGCTSLESVPTILPAKKVEEEAYSNMFASCRSITTAPVISATTLSNGCYANMFNSCRSLTTAPALPATTLASNCYNAMFRDCTSLTTAPELPATTLARYCYQNMFNGCHSLATAPALPATTLQYYCYANMFNECWALTTAPDLPATTLTDSCYAEMFRSSGVTSVVCLATTNVTTSNVTAWLADTTTGVGTLYKDPNMEGWVVGTNVPSGWTIEDYVEE